MSAIKWTNELGKTFWQPATSDGERLWRGVIRDFWGEKPGREVLTPELFRFKWVAEIISWKRERDILNTTLAEVVEENYED